MAARNPIWVPFMGLPKAILKIMWDDIPMIPNSEYDPREETIHLVDALPVQVGRVEIVSDSGFDPHYYGAFLFDGEGKPLAHFQGLLFGYDGFGPMCSKEMLAYLGVNPDTASYANRLAERHAVTVFSREKRQKINGIWYAIPDGEVEDEPWRLERPPIKGTLPWWKHLFQ